MRFVRLLFALLLTTCVVAMAVGPGTQWWAVALLWAGGMVYLAAEWRLM